MLPDDVLILARPADSHGLERKLGVGLIMKALGGDAEDGPSLGRFRVEAKIGGGAMGTVYRAFDPELERVVAVKVLNTPAGEGRHASMQSEARALARLAHPNVVTIHDIGLSDEQTYVTMEYVEGMNLREWAQGPVPRSWREILVAYLGAARGLSAAHGCGIVHQDFKPENVLMGHDGRVRVVDFGLARRVESDGPAARSSGYLEGTPAYMAPELKEGCPASPASDQFAFCVVLLEALEARATRQRQEALAGVFAALEIGCAPQAERRHSSMERIIDALDDALVVPVAGDYREVLVARLAETFAEADAPHSLTSATLTPLSLEDAPVHTAEGQRCLPSTRALTESLHEAFDRSGGSLLLLGGPGAGKSTALSQLGQRLLERARRDPRESLPLLINLASLGEFEDEMEAWLAGEVLARYGLPEIETHNRLRAEAWVLLLDGLDEVSKSSRERAIDRINELRKRHPVPVVVGSREFEYVQSEARVGCRGAVRIAPLDDEQRLSLLAHLGPVAEGLSAELVAHPERGEKLSTPLLLTLAALGESDANEEDDEPGLRARLYDGFLRKTLGDPATDPEARELEAGARWLARAMYDRGLSEFWVERLQADWLERPAARFAAKLAGVLLIFIVGLLVTGIVAVFTQREVHVPIILSLAAIPVVVVLNRGLSIRPIDELRWSWRRSVEWIPKATGAGAFLGGVYGLVYVFWFNFLVGAICGLIACVPLGVESSREIIGVRPNRSIRRSALNALGIGGITGILSGTIAGGAFVWVCMPYLPPESPMKQLEDPYTAGMTMTGACVFVTSGMAGGGMAVAMHTGLRIVLAASTPLPLRLVTFLERLVERGLLRRVGGGYVFPHRTLLRHLAGRGPAPLSR